ncbi:type I secretion system permease/ATPase [Aquamicrobium sp. LC103]|uniref:type I secretion system permease/ATPase n=1 Tax=Aquamicrobium sp. LC103 TaxID=1120658 RepID=UPI000A476A52|nr:type I secretion system permease/ATPase [Aquamicrobium sp. LC103]TKT69303.1 type I secretion system permease/ATPase [Aquamicrobium sp. LC103]
MEHTRAQPWRPFTGESGEPGFTRTSEPGSARSLSQMLHKQEEIVDRSMAELDRAIVELKQATQSLSNRTSSVEVADPSPQAEILEPDPEAPVGTEGSRAIPTGTARKLTEPRIEAAAGSSVPIRDEAHRAGRAESEPRPEAQDNRAEAQPGQDFEARPGKPGTLIIEGDRDPIKVEDRSPTGGGNDVDKGGGGGGGGGHFHRRLGPINFAQNLQAGIEAVRKNLLVVMIFTVASNILVLAIPIYLFQISDRVLTSRSIDTLIMLTIVIVGAVLLQAALDAIRRFILMRTAVEVAAQLGTPILSAAARASLNSNGREYQTLGDLQQLRSFLVSGTLLAFLDAPMAPLFILAVFLVHIHLGFIVVGSMLALLVIAALNQRATAAPFGEANAHQSKANLHLDSMSRNSQIINALAMIPEAVRIWGKDTAGSLKAQVIAQDRNIVSAATSKAARLLTQVAMLGWGAFLSIEGEITGGMVIAASIIAGRALAPVEGAIEGWNQFVQSRAAYGRISALLQSSPLNFERLHLPRPEGRLDVERLLFVPQGTKRVVLNGITFSLAPGDSLAIIGNSGAGKTTLGKMLVGSILPTSGNVRLDLMDLRNWDQRQFGENIGYLPQDVQLFPASIKANIARMREDASDADIYQAAMLADVHEMIATFPQGYETFVAADGAPLSGGQKQRIALARAFFGNPRLVVLDEPNSNLDSAGDAALARALAHAKREKITVITITQRPALLRNVDKILLLTNGTVALFGGRQDVLQALAARGMAPGGAGPLATQFE